MSKLGGEWEQVRDIGSKSYLCGYCDERTGIRVGYQNSARGNRIYICGGCNRPTFFDDMLNQTPSPIAGNNVEQLPTIIESPGHNDNCNSGIDAYTACVLVCRKILMHIAVEEGADEKLNFFQYVEYLAENGFVPPKGKDWVDYIRSKGNEANHEIVLVSKEDGLKLLSFTELLLKFVYEMPARITPTSTEEAQA